jgi:plastocyanin
VPETVADSAPADTGAAEAGVKVGGCSQADFDAPAGANGGDFTAQANVDITFPTDPTPAQYNSRCAKVKVGSTVTFKGSFRDHPLQPNGGDSPTPIVRTTSDPDGGFVVVTFAVKGTYGYECMLHPLMMLGAVQVVP